MFQEFLQWLSPFFTLVGAYLLIAVLLAYISRWSSLRDERWVAWIWPVALMIFVWSILSDGIRWLSHFVVFSLDRMIYRLTRHKIDESEYGILWVGRMPYGRHLEVEVRDSTGRYTIPVSPDNDALLVKEATPSRYALGGWLNDAVRTDIKTAKQAVEWTYDLKDGELNPITRA